MTLISEKMQTRVNEQIKHELESAYIYLSMSNWLAGKNFDNLANWFHEQAIEEYDHARKFMAYILNTGGNITLESLNKPKQDWTSVAEILKAAYNHEQFITGKIQEMVHLATEIKELAIMTLLQWFIQEQIEEEASTEALVVKHSYYKNDMLFDSHIKREPEEEGE